MHEFGACWSRLSLNQKEMKSEKKCSGPECMGEIVFRVLFRFLHFSAKKKHNSTIFTFLTRSKYEEHRSISIHSPDNTLALNAHFLHFAGFFLVCTVFTAHRPLGATRVPQASFSSCNVEPVRPARLHQLSDTAHHLVQKHDAHHVQNQGSWGTGALWHARSMAQNSTPSCFQHFGYL